MKTLVYAVFSPEGAMDAYSCKGELHTGKRGAIFNEREVVELVSRQDAEDIIKQRNGEIARLQEYLANAVHYGNVWRLTSTAQGERITGLIEQKQNSKRLVKQWQQEMEDKSAALKADLIREQNTVAELQEENDRLISTRRCGPTCGGGVDDYLLRQMKVLIAKQMDDAMCRGSVLSKK